MSQSAIETYGWLRTYLRYHWRNRSQLIIPCGNLTVVYGYDSSRGMCKYHISNSLSILLLSVSRMKTLFLPPSLKIVPGRCSAFVACNTIVGAKAISPFSGEWFIKFSVHNSTLLSSYTTLTTLLPRKRNMTQLYIAPSYRNR